MANRTTSKSNSSKKSSTASKSVSTPVRNSAIPRSTAPTQSSNRASSFGSNTQTSRQVTHEMIAKRAYEIWQSGKGGNEYDNWLRAERELRGGNK